MKIKNQGLIFTSLLIVSLLGISSWQIQRHIESVYRQDVGKSLQTILDTTRQALHSWQQEQTHYISTHANSPEIIAATRKLLALPENPDTLRKASIQKQLRKMMQPTLSSREYLGYFIISPDNISLASSRDINIGTTNLLVNQPQFLENLWSGRTAISGPMQSDVPLNNNDPSQQLPETMFVGSPIHDDDKIIALLTFRIDLDKYFDKLLQRGRIGNTGETYVFDSQGKLISTSRFEKQLRQSGLPDESAGSFTHISIREPVARPDTGDHGKSSAQGPLTAMAQQAINGHSGINTRGYRDYRGVPVIGAWYWDTEQHYGVATEIDKSEAYRSLRYSRWLVTVFTLMAMASLIGLSMLFLWSRRRLLASEKARQDAERRETALQLQDKEARLGLILDSAADGIITINERGIIQAFNKQAESLFGYSASEAVGKNVSIIVPEPDRSAHDHYLSRYLSTGIARIIGSNREVLAERKDGSTFPVSLAISEAKIADQHIFTAIVHDLSEKKRTEDNLRKLSRVVEQSPSSVVITDRQGNIEYVNPKFCTITGYTAEEVIGRNPRILKSGHTTATEYEQLWQDITSKGEWRGEFKNINKDGEPYWESTYITAVRNTEGHIEHFIAVKENITARKIAEQALQQAKQDAEQARQKAEQANQAKSEFLANMSHEIRTPLGGVIGMAHLLSDTELDKQQETYLRKLTTSTENLLFIVNDILDFSKIEAGKIIMESVPFELEEVLLKLSHLISPKAHEKQLDLFFDISPDTPDSLLGDPLRLGQILLNLSSNAVKFTQTGEILISVEVHESRPDVTTLKFSVSDTGIGLDQKQINSLFKAFTQADESTTRRFGGTGLGLSISKQLISLMGGKISVDSEPGKGSCFYFTAQFQCPPPKEQQDNKQAAFSLKGKRALIIDSKTTSRRILEKQLVAYGMMVNSVANGKAALAAISTASKTPAWELIILDQELPDNQSSAITHYLLKQQNAANPIPVIMMQNTLANEEATKLDEQYELFTCIGKPVLRAELHNAILNALHPHPRQQIKAPTFDKAVFAPAKVLKNKHVLLVEDNEVNQEIAKKILEKAGMIVTVAVNGLEAVDRVAESAFDLVLMDIQMPEMDGYQASRLLRQQTQLDNMPILAMTANVMTAEKEKCLRAGMNDHIAKPFKPEELYTVIAKWLSRSKSTKRSASEKTV